jgi:hypothetical protein
MANISKITVTSSTNLGLQVCKDHLTPIETKILKQMLNENVSEGQVRNKIFSILETEGNAAKVVIRTIEKCVILNCKQITKRKLTIKYS